MIEEALKKGYGRLSDTGALIVETGNFTGRAVQQKFIVRDAETESRVAWGKVNQPVPEETSSRLWEALERKFHGRSGEAYTYRGYIGPFSIEVNSFSPWHIAFAENMFRRSPSPVSAELRSRIGEKTFRILHDPFGKVSELGVPFQSDTAIILDPARARVLIVGTAYAGEIKKSAFSLCNYLLPEFGVMPMHASANCLEDGSASCVLFGLSGTGKTTLSASPDRMLIGDDEIMWTPTGITNLEGGCYAKLIDLDEDKEPQIYRAVNRYGAILENVVADPKTGKVNFADRSRTENTRGSYPLEALDKVFDPTRQASAPSTIIFLTADAFGALPAVARLDSWQAQYHFISGYTAKVAGTELGIKTPEVAFSACFGAPFMPRPVSVYARLLAEYAQKANASVWLLNTGWTQGGFGKGPRFPIPVSRQILSAIQNGALDRVPMRKHPIFGFEVPSQCPGVDAKYLELPDGESVQALASRFDENVRKFGSQVPREVIEKGGPRISAIDMKQVS